MYFDPPAPSLLAGEARDAVSVMHLAAWLADEMTDQMMGERPIIHIGAGDDPRRSNGLIVGSALHHERCPFLDLLPVLGVFHAVIAMVRAHRLEPLSEERDVAAMHEAHVRDRMYEGARIGDGAFLDEEGPE